MRASQRVGIFVFLAMIAATKSFALSANPPTLPFPGTPQIPLPPVVNPPIPVLPEFGSNANLATLISAGVNASPVQGVCFRTVSDPADGHSMAEVTVKWSSAFVLIAQPGEIPITIHKHSEPVDIGSLKVVQNNYRVPAGPDMILRLDIDELSDQVGGGIANTLPNGLAIPLAADSEDIHKIPLDHSDKNYLYFTAGQNALMIGFTMRVGKWDKIGKRLPTPMRFFLPVMDPRTGREMFSGGVYTSRDEGKNGVGIFMDLSDIYSTGSQLICR